MLAAILERTRAPIHNLYGRPMHRSLRRFASELPPSELPPGEQLAAALATRTAAIPHATAMLINRHLLAIEPSLWPVQVVEAFYAYYQIESRLPSVAEAREQISRMNRIESDPAGYSAAERVPVGVPVETVATRRQGDGMCTMCLESQEQKIVWTLQCGHGFCCGIEQWLRENVQCPLCRADVRGAA